MTNQTQKHTITFYINKVTTTHRQMTNAFCLKITNTQKKHTAQIYTTLQKASNAGKSVDQQGSLKYIQTPRTSWAHISYTTIHTCS